MNQTEDKYYDLQTAIVEIGLLCGLIYFITIFPLGTIPFGVTGSAMVCYALDRDVKKTDLYHTMRRHNTQITCPSCHTASPFRMWVERHRVDGPFNDYFYVCPHCRTGIQLDDLIDQKLSHEVIHPKEESIQ